MKGYVKIETARVIQATLNYKAEYERVKVRYDELVEITKNLPCERNWLWASMSEVTCLYDEVVSCYWGEFRESSLRKLYPEWEEDVMLFQKMWRSKRNTGGQVRRAAQACMEDTMLCDLELGSFVHKWAEFNVKEGSDYAKD